MNNQSERARRLERISEYRAARRSGSSASEAREQVDDDDEEKVRITDFAAKADFEIRQATARGDFDNLKYAGKPIPGARYVTGPGLVGQGPDRTGAALRAGSGTIPAEKGRRRAGRHA